MHKKIPLLLFILFATCLTVIVPYVSTAGEQVSAVAVVDRQEVYVGESLLLQIQVNGADNPEQPTLAPLDGLTTEYRGGQQNSSESITIINGTMERLSRRGYFFSYAITPTKAGRLTIPAIAITVDGETHLTAPLTITARVPEESDDSKLLLTLDTNEAYVGQIVELAVTWYIGRDANDFSFNLPVISDTRFTVIPKEIPAGGNTEHVLKIPLAGREVLAKKGTASLNGREYTTVKCTFFLIPRTAGSHTLPQATVSAKILSGYRRNQPGNGLGDPFSQNDLFADFFGRQRGNQGIYRTVIAPSNQPSLTVHPLPTAGQPDGFTGLVGPYSLATEASPTEVNVGDPITLTIMVTGPTYLDNVELPPLNQMAGFAGQFKIPAEMAPGQIQGHAKIFTQTIRATSPDTKSIPAVHLPFFDPASGRYETARSQPISLTVRQTKVITANDAIGAALPAGNGKIQESGTGIAHNYETPDVLVSQQPRTGTFLLTPAWIIFLLLPPMLLAGLAIFRRLAQARRLSPTRQRAKNAAGRFRAAVHSLPDTPAAACDIISQAFTTYLRDRFDLPAGAMTTADLSQHLRQTGFINRQISADIQAVFETCEAGRFAGGTVPGSDSSAELARKTLAIVDRLETFFNVS